MTTTKKFQQTTDETKRARVLLVEDDDLFAKILVKVLSKEHDVTHANDGIEASRVLTEQSFDIIISDLLLPGISGMELLRLIRTYDLDVPLVILTGQPTFDTAIEAIRLGAFRYMVKPVELTDLEDVITKGVALSRLARAKREALALSLKQSTKLEPFFMGDSVGLEVRFEQALAGLYLVFQPIFSALENRVVAYEALMRSNEPSMSTPGAVLDAAERLGRLGELGRAIRSLATLSTTTMPRNASLFVNIHTAELSDRFLFEGDCPLVPHAQRVVLEVTERAAIDDVVDLAKRTRLLRNRGFRMALDDLGAGYAGLSTFAALEPEIVKVDMSLIRNVHTSVVKQRVLRSIVTLCREMNMVTVAEGIETQEELACVKEVGCDLLQGYLLGKPGKSFVIGSSTSG